MQAEQREGRHAQTAAPAAWRTCTVSFCYLFIISNKQFEQEFQAVTSNSTSRIVLEFCVVSL